MRRSVIMGATLEKLSRNFADDKDQTDDSVQFGNKVMTE